MDTERLRGQEYLSPLDRGINSVSGDDTGSPKVNELYVVRVLVDEDVLVFDVSMVHAVL